MTALYSAFIYAFAILILGIFLLVSPEDTLRILGIVFFLQLIFKCGASGLIAMNSSEGPKK